MLYPLAASLHGGPSVPTTPGIHMLPPQPSLSSTYQWALDESMPTHFSLAPGWCTGGSNVAGVDP